MNLGEMIIVEGAIIDARGIAAVSNGILTIVPGASWSYTEPGGMFSASDSRLNNYGTLSSTIAG